MAQPLFPTGRSGLRKIVAGGWREAPMEVVSGPLGRERVHFEAPAPHRIGSEMADFLTWLNENNEPSDSVLRAGIAHFWFVTIHPFDDGNGRIARTIADMLLARSEETAQRFYSFSAQIRRERSAYYSSLEEAQKGSLDITEHLLWFLGCLDRAIAQDDDSLVAVLMKARFWQRHAAEPVNDRQRNVLNRLLDGFEGKLTSSKWAKLTKSSQATAGRDIDDLVRRGILRREPAGGRSTSYALVRHEPE